MKRAIILGLALALGGCAGLPGNSEPPHYDYSQAAYLAPGFPVERIDQPQGFGYATEITDSYQSGYRMASDPGQASVSDAGIGWNRKSGNTSVATALFRRVDGNSVMLPLDHSDGYLFAGGQRVQYVYSKGYYREVVGNSAGIVPTGAPGCAFGTTLVVTSQNAKRRFIGTYADGIACEKLGGVSDLDFRDQRDRALHAFGLH